MKGIFEGWKTTMSGYLIFSISGKSYLSLMDFAQDSPPQQGKAVEFEVDGVPQDRTLELIKSIQIIS
jgi:hypothetical protein